LPKLVDSADPPRELAQELREFHSVIDATLEQFAINVKAKIAEMLYVLENHINSSQRTTLPEQQELERMIYQLKKLSSKPKKGRVKELKKIQNLLEECLTKFPSYNR
jgi:hypothetical protein